HYHLTRPRMEGTMAPSRTVIPLTLMANVGPPASWRKAFVPFAAALAIALSTARSGDASPLLRHWDDLPYRTVDGVTIRLNVSAPDSGTFPAVVWVHGGSWQQGDKDIQKYRDRADGVAADGFVAFNVNFRLACSDPLNPLCGYHFPAPVEDI